MATTTVRALIDALETAAAELGDDTTVAVAIQPSYPLAVSVTNVAVDEYDDDEAGIEYNGAYDRPTPTLWLGTGNNAPDGRSPYAPSAAFNNDYL